MQALQALHVLNVLPPAPALHASGMHGAARNLGRAESERLGGIPLARAHASKTATHLTPVTAGGPGYARMARPGLGGHHAWNRPNRTQRGTSLSTRVSLQSLVTSPSRAAGQLGTPWMVGPCSPHLPRLSQQGWSFVFTTCLGRGCGDGQRSGGPELQGGQLS